MDIENIRNDITRAVTYALQEDIGPGDITAELISPQQQNNAYVITREECIFCGQAWLEETFEQIGGISKIDWRVKDGDAVAANTKLVDLAGNTRSLLTGERTALNFLQLLSATATTANHYAKRAEHKNLKILDTRKTIPGLRMAQKYAVVCGGGHSHRIGLYDMFLIKENHIAASGGISEAVEKARELHPSKQVEVEVTNIDELKQAISAKADIIMLDNFSKSELQQAIAMDRGDIDMELSGNLGINDLNRLSALIPAKETWRLSFGAITKHIQAVDLSMRIVL